MVIARPPSWALLLLPVVSVVADPWESAAPLEGSQPPAPPLPQEIDGAFPDCPCIDHETDPTFKELADKHLAGFRLAKIQLVTGMTVRRDYGSAKCHVWDEEGEAFPLCTTYAAQDFCELKWCFVDPLNCHPRRRPRRSTRLEDMYLSYSTCGNVYDNLMGAEHWAVMSPIAVYAMDEEVRWNLEGLSGTGAWLSIMKFAADLLRKLQVPKHALEYRSLSQKSLDLHDGSRYRACVHDLALGHLDLCVGDFWDTPARRELKISFTNTIYSDLLYLFTSARGKELDLAEHLHKPLEPFSGALWILIGGVIVFSAFALVLFEHQEPGGDFEDMSVARAVWEGFYRGMSDFVNAGVDTSPQTLSGKIFALALAFFITVTIASFTANTASFLSYRPTVLKAESLDEALDLGLTVCVPQILKDLIVASFPRLQEVGVAYERIPDVFEAMRAGLCDAMVVPDSSVRERHAEKDLCDIVGVGRPLLAVPVGMFVSERLQYSINWALAEARRDGTWYNLDKLVNPDSACVSVEAKSLERQILQPHHMGGNCCLLLICFGVAMVQKMLKRVERTKSVRRIEEEVSTVAEAATVAVIDEVEEVIEEVQEALGIHSKPSEGAHNSYAVEAEPAKQAGPEAGEKAPEATEQEAVKQRPEDGALKEPLEDVHLEVEPEEDELARAYREQRMVV